MFDFSFFDEVHDRTKTSAIKYTDLPKSEKGTVIPMWIADMDFLSAPAITEALKKTAEPEFTAMAKLTMNILVLLQIGIIVEWAGK